MSSNVNPIPDCFNTVSIHMTVNNAAEAIEFYKKAFGAEEVCRMPGPDGNSVMHSELKIGNSAIMLNDEFPGHGLQAPATLKPANSRRCARPFWMMNRSPRLAIGCPGRRGKCCRAPSDVLSSM